MIKGRVIVHQADPYAVQAVVQVCGYDIDSQSADGSVFTLSFPAREDK